MPQNSSQPSKQLENETIQGVENQPFKMANKPLPRNEEVQFQRNMIRSELTVYTASEFQLRIHHRIAALSDVGKDLWRSTCPTTLLKQVQLDLVAQDHTQVVLESLQRRFYNLLGKPDPEL